MSPSPAGRLRETEASCSLGAGTLSCHFTETSGCFSLCSTHASSFSAKASHCDRVRGWWARGRGTQLGGLGAVTALPPGAGRVGRQLQTNPRSPPAAEPHIRPEHLCTHSAVHHPQAHPYGHTHMHTHTPGISRHGYPIGNTQAGNPMSHWHRSVQSSIGPPPLIPLPSEGPANAAGCWTYLWYKRVASIEGMGYVASQHCKQRDHGWQRQQIAQPSPPGSPLRAPIQVVT